MEKVSSPSINLAKNRGEHISDRILRFALTVGRVLVIVTEAVALGAFLFRFGLDRQLVDLHDRIKQEQAIVNLLKSNETVYRNLQDRLLLEKNINTNVSNSAKLYQDIYNMIPSDMALTGLSFSDSNIRIDGGVPTLITLSGLVKKIQAYPSVQRVSLDKLENKSSEGVINVSMTVYMKTANKPIL